jgi:hypothetical protein
MMKTRTFLLCGLALLAVSGVARADWDVGDYYKMHYPQLPNMVPGMGLDVLASQQQGYGAQWKILADDWMCTETGPVTGIHIWGSWFQAPPDPTALFKLSIHSNIAGTLYSQPGDELWSAVITPAQYAYRPWATGYMGHFWDPNFNVPYQNGVLGDDNGIWQYNFTNLPMPYVQQKGTIYWLDVQAVSPMNHVFGWTTTDPSVTPHFMDDAVFADTAGFNGPLVTGWTPLVYPAGHPYAGQSVDLAFVIVPLPAALPAGLVGLAGLAGLRAWWRRKSTP